LSRLKKRSNENIYGIERNDEFGIISNIIQDLFINGHRDGLTGLYNRRFMEENLQEIIGSLSRSKGRLSLFIIDVDFFKKYNDKYGHDMGDTCLKQLANVLTNVITRTDDIVARYGGEEFVVILPNTDRPGAEVVANRLLKSVRELKIPHENNIVEHITVSIGITTGDVVYTQKWENYLKQADQALYLSKQSGRDKFSFLPFGEL
jgi:diguanylate cyclase (GGDEF)-like protein